MSHRKIRLKLDGVLDAIEGDGNTLTVKVKGYRRTKANNGETYEIEFSACRGVVRKLLMQIKEMHKRDRARIADEQRRIVGEVAILAEESDT